MPQLLTSRETANILRVNPWTLRRWVRQGQIPCVHLGRKLLFNADALAATIRQASQPVTAA